MPTTKEYEIEIKGQYWPKPESIWIRAATAKEAISIARRTARNEGWHDRRNDGRVTFKHKAF